MFTLDKQYVRTCSMWTLERMTSYNCWAIPSHPATIFLHKVKENLCENNWVFPKVVLFTPWMTMEGFQMRITMQNFLWTLLFPSYLMLKIVKWLVPESGCQIKPLYRLNASVIHSWFFSPVRTAWFTVGVNLLFWVQENRISLIYLSFILRVVSQLSRNRFIMVRMKGV